ncbi:DUF6708 domain-containing protein [Pseudomonas putida]|nr:DUF6708 domain-containing protein [Pseudomonas putida]
MKTANRDIGWKYDLPSPLMPPELECSITEVFPPPTQINKIFLDLPLSRIPFRGILSIAGLAILLTSAAISAFLAIHFIASPRTDHTLIIQLMLAWIATFYLLTPYIRLDLMLPRNEPIRFNRCRQKVYFYHYRFDRIRPLGRKSWGVKPVTYEWNTITAEYYRVYLPMGHGGVVEKVMLSVRAPETGEVIDRLLLADNLEKGKQYWVIARQFMQSGPEELPDFKYAPHDPERDDHPNPFHRLAPKVEWPADMGLESRTAPGSGDQS